MAKQTKEEVEAAALKQHYDDFVHHKAATRDLKAEMTQQLNQVIGSYSLKAYELKSPIFDGIVQEQAIKAHIEAALVWCRASQSQPLDFDALVEAVKKDLGGA